MSIEGGKSFEHGESGFEGESARTSSSLVNGVDRWLHCKYAIPQVDVLTEPSRSDGPQEGYNSDYSCKNPEVIERVETRDTYVIDEYYTPDGELVFSAFEMHPFGNTEEPRVKANLNLWCGKCPFFENKNS
jgi:hypothetical protein